MLAALFGAAASFIATSIKTGRDEQRDLCNDFTKAVLEAATLASEYWLSEPGADKIRLFEARLLGMQSYLDRYRVIALTWFSPRDRDGVTGLLASYYDALTGGAFKGAGRAVDPQRAELVQVIAAELAVTIRAGNLRSLGLWRQFLRVVGFDRLREWIQRERSKTRDYPSED